MERRTDIYKALLYIVTKQKCKRHQRYEMFYLRAMLLLCRFTYVYCTIHLFFYYNNVLQQKNHYRCTNVNTYFLGK